MSRRREAARKITKEEAVPGTWKFIESKWIRGKPHIVFSESYSVSYSDGTSEVVTKTVKQPSPTSRWITKPKN